MEKFQLKRWKIKEIAALILLLTIIFAGCKKDSPEPAIVAAERTILVYMGGDNNLYQETDEKLEALREGYTIGMGRLFIYQDAAGKDPRLLEISARNQEEATVRVIRNYPQQNSASSPVFTQVLNHVKAEAPASSYGLILFSHASGWLPERSLISPSAVAQDRRDDLELVDFAAAIPDDFFDFIIFEACFMSGIEVMYQLKDKTNYIVSSSAEILSPGFTPLYSQLLPFLYMPEADLSSFARTFFDHYNIQSGDRQSATVSVVRTGALPALADWVRQNAQDVLPADKLKEVQHYDRYSSYRLFFDFEDYYQRLSPSGSHAGLSQLIHDAVIYKAATSRFMPGYSGFEIRHFSGLTSYISQPKFRFLNEEYKKLAWTKAIFRQK